MMRILNVAAERGTGRRWFGNRWLRAEVVPLYKKEMRPLVCGFLIQVVAILGTMSTTNGQ
jgi:hypothetical protein